MRFSCFFFFLTRKVESLTQNEEKIGGGGGSGFFVVVVYVCGPVRGLVFFFISVFLFPKRIRAADALPHVLYLPGSPLWDPRES